jgi:acyl-coenzyme A thioesterase PaaI-like protein
MKRQPGSKMCFVCGRENPIGLHVPFFVDGETVVAEFVPQPEHQGYPGVMHGGLVTTLLDETIGRAAFLRDMWAVTGRLEVRFRRSVPIGEKITITSRITRIRNNVIEAEGEVRLADGTVAVEGRGLYIKVPDEQLREMETAAFGPGGLAAYLAEWKAEAA